MSDDRAHRLDTVVEAVANADDAEREYPDASSPGRAAAVTGKIAFGHQPSSKVVTPKMRSWAREGGSPKYIRAVPKTSSI